MKIETCIDGKRLSMLIKYADGKQVAEAGIQVLDGMIELAYECAQECGGGSITIRNCQAPRLFEASVVMVLLLSIMAGDPVEILTALEGLVTAKVPGEVAGVTAVYTTMLDTIMLPRLRDTSDVERIHDLMQCMTDLTEWVTEISDEIRRIADRTV